MCVSAVRNYSTGFIDLFIDSSDLCTLNWDQITSPVDFFYEEGKLQEVYCNQ